MTMNKWTLAVVIPWLVLFGFGLGIEILGVVNPTYPTFTGLVRKYVPLFVVFVAWCALGWHFIFRYYLPQPH